MQTGKLLEAAKVLDEGNDQHQQDQRNHEHTDTVRQSHYDLGTAFHALDHYQKFIEQ